METKDRGRASELAAGSSQATIIDSAEVGSSKRISSRTTRRRGKRIVTRGFTTNDDGSSSGRSLYKALIGQIISISLPENLVKERFSSTEPTDDKERTLWVELKRLFEPNTDVYNYGNVKIYHDPLNGVYSDNIKERLGEDSRRAERPKREKRE
ncbi:hypothetical protein Tco_1252861 [Tanacetum coccineum]